MLRPDFLRGIGRLKQFSICLRHPIFPNNSPPPSNWCLFFPSSSSFSITCQAFDQRPLALRPGRATARAGQSPECFCKVSGSITERSMAPGRKNDFRPYLDVAFEPLAKEPLALRIRLAVCLLSGSYAQSSRLWKLLGWLRPNHSGKIWGGNAARIYNLDLRKADRVALTVSRCIAGWPPAKSSEI